MILGRARLVSVSFHPHFCILSAAYLHSEQYQTGEQVGGDIGYRAGVDFVFILSRLDPGIQLVLCVCAKDNCQRKSSVKIM